MKANTPARALCATIHPFSRMDAYQLLQATKTLVAAQQLSAFAFTSAQAINAEDQGALVDWEEARMESLSDQLFELLQEFDRRKDLDADGQAYRDIAVAISHDVVVKSHWQVSVRRSA
ncbi:MAG: hypothetical protein ACOH2N_00570 [Devosia sp.]